MPHIPGITAPDDYVEFTSTKPTIVGSVGATRTKFKIGFVTKRFSIINTHATQDITLFLEEDANGITLVADGGSFAEEIAIHEFELIGTGAATTFEAVAVHR